MMNSADFAESLEDLGLDHEEAGQLLGMSARSVRRWCDSEAVPGPVEAAVRAWLQLHRQGLAWKPGSMSVLLDDQLQIQRMREHATILHQLIQEVDRDGGPKTKWHVDVDRRRATNGVAEVSFYLLTNGSFSPSTYRRLDRAPSEDDRAEIRDACYCIAQAFAEARKANKALYDIAEYTSSHAHLFAKDRADEVDADERAAAITRVAEDLLALAMRGTGGKITYPDFDVHLRRLHALGFYPRADLVGAVANLLVARRPQLDPADLDALRQPGNA
jgi:hypothetical protein